RESRVALMPTSSIPGGLAPPIENSPPGIHTIPSGVGPGAGLALATVGRNVETAAGGVVVAECMAADSLPECDERRAIIAYAAIASAPAPIAYRFMVT